MKATVAKLAVIMLIMAVWQSSCEKEENHPEDFRLIKVLYYSKSTSAQPDDGIEYTYDETGNMVKESFFDYLSATALRQYREYEYSGNRKSKMKVFDGKNGNLELKWYVDYFYENNRIIREEFKKPDDFLYGTTNYEYNSGNLIREYYLDDGVISGEMKYTYDTKNRLILEENDASDVKKIKYIQYTYDNNGRKSKLEYYNVNRDLLKYIEKVYNGGSKLPVKDLHYDKDGKPIAQYQHYYDKLGNLTETRYKDDCSLFRRKFQNGLLVEEIKYVDPFEKGGCSENGTARYEYEEIKK